MDEVRLWLNTALLLILLIYQWNKNKVLTERIDHQTLLLQDTKSVVTQQATALESQAKVVETAVRYSEAFDPKKLEEVLRKQVESENVIKISLLETEFKKSQSENEEIKSNFQNIFEMTLQSTSAFIIPIMKLVMGLMIHVSMPDRDALINELPEGPIKNQLTGASKQIEMEYKKALIEKMKEYTASNEAS